MTRTRIRIVRKLAAFALLAALPVVAGTASAGSIPTTGLVLGLGADTNVTANGGVVSAWGDESTGLNVVGGTVGSPTLTTALFPNGTHPVVSFNNVDGISFNSATTSALSMQNFDVYVVASLAQNELSRIFVTDYVNIGGFSNGWATGIADTGALNNVKWFTGPDGSDTLGGSTGLTMTPGQPYLITNGISNGTKTASLFDGTTTQTATPDTANPSGQGGVAPGQIPYGAGQQSGLGYLVQFGAGRQGLIGNIAEVLVYNNTVGGYSPAAVETYLDNKYFLVVPEPSSLALLAFAGILVAMRGLARRRNSGSA